MGFGDIPPPPKSPHMPPAEVHRIADKSDDLFNSIFAVKNQNNDRTESVNDLGRIASLSLPGGWVRGRETETNGGYAREYHPKENNAAGELVDKGSVQMIFSYRGHRLSDKSSQAFRELIDSAAPDGKPQLVDPHKLQQAPLNEVLGDLGHKNTFRVISARVEKVNGEPALVVEGKYTNHEVNAKLIYIDAERNARDKGNAPVQEIAVMAPTREFYKYSMTVNKSLSEVRWKP